LKRMKIINSKIEVETDSTKGRLGPNVVLLNQQGSTGILEFKENGLEVESNSNFSSIRANVCVFKGKWMYEATLGTGGIQQIGWAPLECPFTNEEGVGDSPDSFAYDGKRIKKWNVTNQTYGQPWMIGDVIGCCIDLDKGEISFYRNGQSLGVAFSNVRFGENAVGLAYFPAISLSFGEKCYLNFGSRPFEYPVENFMPLQNVQSPLLNAQYLVESLERLVPYTIMESNNNETKVYRGLHLSSEDIVILFASVFQHLCPLLNDEYITISVFKPFLEKLLIQRKKNDLKRLLDLMFLCAEPHELKGFFSSLFSYIGYRSKINSYPIALGIKENLFLSLKLAICLLKCPNVMEEFLQLPSYMFYLESIFSTKQPDSTDLLTLIPYVWWPSENEEIKYKEKMDYSLNNLTTLYNTNEKLLLKLSVLFLKNTKNFISSNLSPSQAFRNWIRFILKKNKGALRNVIHPGLSDDSVLKNLYFVLLNLIQDFLKSTNISGFPNSMFYDDQLDYFDFSRIGGTIGHLQKNMPILNDPNRKQPISLEVEILDDIMMLYHLGISSQFKQASIYLQKQTQIITQLEETNRRIKRARELSENVETLLSAKKISTEDLVHNIRQCMWYRVTLFTQWKKEAMFSCVSYLVSLIQSLSHLDPLFSYIPEFYLETLIDSFHALRRGDPPLIMTDASRINELFKIISFIVDHFDDKRIINPDIRDLLIQSLSVLLQYQDFIRVFEQENFDRKKLISSLLQSFDVKSWNPISTILLRFWRGTAFAQSPKKQQDCSSEVYQKVFRDTCSKDLNLLNGFLNRIFNNLNWALSEFGVSAKEFLSISRNYSEIQQIQRKCFVMLEFSSALLQMIEFVSQEVPSAFLDQDINLARLSESLIFVLNRTTTSPDSKLFVNIFKSKVPALEKPSLKSILAPIAGILINLSNYNGRNSFSKTLVSTGGLNLETFQFLCTFDWQEGTEENLNLKEKIEELRKIVDQIKNEVFNQEKEQKEISLLPHSPSAEFCSICYSSPIDTRFEPCNHRSCNKCIQRHLLNSKKCFFCNSIIEKIILEE